MNKKEAKDERTPVYKRRAVTLATYGPTLAEEGVQSRTGTSNHGCGNVSSS